MRATTVYIIAILILVGGLRLASAVYDQGRICHYNTCYSSNQGFSKLIGSVSIASALGIAKAANEF